MKKKLFFCLALMTMLCAFSVAAYADVFQIKQPIVLNLEGEGSLLYKDGSALESDLAEHIYLKNGVLYLDNATIYADYSGSSSTCVLSIKGGGKDAVILVSSDSSFCIEERSIATTPFAKFRMIDARECNLIITGPGGLTLDVQNKSVTSQVYAACAIASRTLSVIGKAQVYAYQMYSNDDAFSGSSYPNLLEVDDENGVPSQNSLCQMKGSMNYRWSPLSETVTYSKNSDFKYCSLGITAADNEQEGTITSLPGSTSAAQRYSLLDVGDGYIDVVRVDYAWTTPAFDISSAGTYVWDPATLSWKGSKGEPVIINQSDATMEFTNRSSVPVKASAVFNVVEGYSDILPNGATFVNNNCTINSVVNQTTKEVDKTKEHAQTITASLPLVVSQLSKLKSGMHQEFGTFVVTIE